MLNFSLPYWTLLVSQHEPHHLTVFFSLTSKFELLGNVYALGFSDWNPLLVLVEINKAMDTAPPLYINDDYGR